MKTYQLTFKDKLYFFFESRYHKRYYYSDNYNIYLISRIDKAIEILKLCNSKCAKETINILKGEDKDANI